jgi:uncharacterized protein (TIGR02594 family)
VEWLDKVKGLFKGSTEDLSEELIAEASKWIGIHEKRGENSLGVNSFRKAVDNMADGEPWCAAFVGYCVRAVSLRTNAPITIYLSELCSDMWANTNRSYKKKEPVPGSIIVWNYTGSIHGHTGIVVKRVDKDHIMTIEGNTKNPNGGGVSGTGVYFKTRKIKGDDGMAVLGFLLPFG